MPELRGPFALPPMRRAIAGLVFACIRQCAHKSCMNAADEALKRMSREALDPFGEVVPRRDWLSIYFSITLILSCFFISWRVFRLSFINLTLSDLLLILCIGLLALSGRTNPFPLGRFSIFWIGGLILMFAGLLASSLLYGEMTRWMIVVSQYVFALLLIPVVYASSNYRLLDRCMLAFVLGVALSQLIGLIALQLFSYADVEQYFGVGFITGNSRLGAMTGEPNPNGYVCAIALVMLFHMKLRGKIPMIFALPLGLLIFCGLIASASFTGFTAATLSLAFLLALSHPANLLKIGLPLVLVAGAYVTAGGPIPAVFQERVGDALVTGDADKAGTFVGRAALINEAWRMADDDMLLGLGADEYQHASIYGAPVHHLHLLILNEGGIIAYLGLLIMILSLFAVGIAVFRRDRYDGAACLAITGTFLIYTMSIPHMYTRVWIAPVLLTVAFVISLARQRQNLPTHGLDRYASAHVVHRWHEPHLI